MPFLLWLSLSFVIGIALGRWSQQPASVWLMAAFGAYAFVLLWRRVVMRTGWRPFGLSLQQQLLAGTCLALVCLGLWRYQYAQPLNSPYQIAWYTDRDYEVLITGSIAQPPDERDAYTSIIIQVQGVDVGNGEDLPVSGLLLARVPINMDYRYGERIRLRGQLKTPPENEEVSYKEYLVRLGITAYMSKAEVTHLPFFDGNRLVAAVFTFKARAVANLYELFPDPEASLLAGILLGDDGNIPQDLQQAFKDTGTAHIIAISGFNIAIIANLFVALFSVPLGKWRASIVALIGIFLYAFLVGASASVVRAAVMGSLGIVAQLIGRRQSAYTALFFVAALMVGFNPQVIWDVGFQLSFGATLGLMMFAAPMQEAATRFFTRYLPADTAKRAAQPIAEYFLFTLAAQIATLPIMAYYFHRLSLSSIIVNPLVLPVQPLVMVLGGIALLCSLVYLPLGKLIAFFAWPFANYTIHVVEAFAKYPQGVIKLGDFNGLFAVAFIVLLLVAAFNKGKVKALRGLFTPATVVTILLILTFVFWRGAVDRPDGQLHITFFNVGSADAVLIQTPTGRAVLVNGGPSASKLSQQLGQRLPPFDRALDWVILGSTQEEQVAALPRVLDRFPPQNVLLAGKLESSYSAGQLALWFSDQAVPVTRAEAGQTLDLGRGAILRVLTLGPRGGVFLIEWNDFRALLPIGMNFDALAELNHGETVGPVSVLLLADQGYAPINPKDWINNLNPQLVILSVAANDESGNPPRATLENLAGYNLLRTDAAGWIRISSDGQDMRVERER